MAYECSSMLFGQAPAEVLALDGWFAEGLRALVANRERLNEVEEALYEASQDPANVAVEELASRLEWDAADLGNLLRAAATLDLGFHEYRRDSPDDWVDDLAGIGLLAREEAKDLVDRLAAIHARHHLRVRNDFGVLPAYESIDFTTEVRGAMVGERPLRLTGICSVALHLDADAPTTYFQISRRQLKALIASLKDAEDELEALERSLVARP